MINQLNDDTFFHIVNYLDIDSIYNLRSSYNNRIRYFTMIVLLHERNYLERLYDNYDTDDFYDSDDK